jgi:processive 1,2-diacylglycerol beta-glucosyltransferase
MREAPQQRWLILTSSTGSGHDMRAYALQEWAQRIYGEEVLVEVYHALEKGSTLGRFGVWLYNGIQRWWPGLHNIYWFIAELFGEFNRLGVGIGQPAWQQKLETFLPHLIVSVHDSLNRGYFSAAKKLLGDEYVKCVTYCGEWDGGFGFSRNWITRAADRIVVRQPEVKRYLERKRVPKGKLDVFCNLLHPKDFEPSIEGAERGRYRVRELGLEAERFTVFLATGALGADRHVGFLNALLPFADRIQLVLVCGRNVQTYVGVKDWAARHPQMRMYLEGFSSRMHRLMQVSDCLLTRGGANTMAEALYFGCPVLFHTHKGIMPQERCTLRFLQRHQIGKRVFSARDLASIVGEWIEHPAEHAAVRERMRQLRAQDHPRDFLEKLHSLAGQTMPAFSRD